MPEKNGSGDPGARGYTAAWQAEYEQINENFRMLADIRFKLLAIVPTLGGVAVYLLSKMTSGISAEAPAIPQQVVGASDYATVVFVSALGFLATLGVTFYDQRNTELYNLLVRRGGELEEMLDPPMKNFKGRVKRGRYLLGLVPMGHDSGLALIYAPVLGAWWFPLMEAALRWCGCSSTHATRVALFSAVIAALILFEEFLRLDGFWTKLFPARR